jgi:uncharacterized membrane protein
VEGIGLNRRRGQLVAILAASALAATAVSLDLGGQAIRAASAILLLLALPGCATALALFPRRSDDVARMLLLTFGLSMSLDVLVALALNLTVGLTASTWAIALAAVTGTACVVGLRRSTGDAPAVPRAFPRLRRSDAVLGVLATVGICVAIVVGRTPLPATNAQGYTALWLVPVDRGGSPRIRVGVTSGEVHHMTYRLVVRSGAHVIYEDPEIELAPGQRVEHVLSLSDRSGRLRVEAQLYRARSLRPYRVATLVAGTADGPSH